MNVQTAAELMNADGIHTSRPHIKEFSLPDQEQILFSFQADTSMPLRVTICWTDPPGEWQPNILDPTNLTLVNDLDLRVVDPLGATNFPWILDPQTPAAAATTGDNFRDNVEQVFLPNTVDGRYTVQVTHKGVLTNQVQDLSMILSGNIPEENPTVFTHITATSAVPRLVWSSTVGTIQNVWVSTNLPDTNAWVVLSDDLSILTESTEWLDSTASNATEQIRAYQIREIQR